MRHIQSFALILAFLASGWQCFAADSVSVTINGKSYSCSESNAAGGSCTCSVDGSYTIFKLNGVQANSWYGNGGTQMVACGNYLKAQSYCGSSTVRCGCSVDGSYTLFMVNGVQANSWYGNGGTQMVACEQHRQQQDFCR